MAVFNPKTGVSKFFPNFLTQKQGFLTQKQVIISKFLQVKKTRFFPKNFQALKNELFQNSQKRKVRKFLSYAGPYAV